MTNQIVNFSFQKARVTVIRVERNSMTFITVCKWTACKKEPKGNKGNILGTWLFWNSDTIQFNRKNNIEFLLHILWGFKGGNSEKLWTNNYNVKPLTEKNYYTHEHMNVPLTAEFQYIRNKSYYMFS